MAVHLPFRLSSMNTAIPLTARIQKPRVSPSAVRAELIAFAVVIAVANASLLWNQWNAPLAFFPTHVAHGEWWRILTHPFVHVSWYHLLLDGSAFLMLYAELAHWTTQRRLSAIGCCGAGSLVAA